MSVLEVIKARRSIGLMKPDLPPRPIIEKMLEAAVCAPNHHKVEPWRFVVIAGEARHEFGKLMEANLLKKLGADATSDKAVAALQKERAKPLRSPVIIAALSLAPQTSKVVDIENVEAVAAAVQNMLLVAEEEGLAAMWRTGDPAYDPSVKAYLNMESNEHIVAFLYVGYPAVPKPEHEPTIYAQKTEWRGWD